jgi:hypothetical protein
MLDLLFRVVIGVAAVSVAGYAVYKLLTRDKVKEEVNERLENEDTELIKAAFAAKVKEKQADSITVDIFSEWDEELITNMEIEGDEVSNDIHIGDVILLVD